MLEAGAFQQARGNRAAIAALAVHGHRMRAIHIGQQCREMIQRLVPRAFHVAALPFRSASYIQNLDSLRVLSLQLVKLLGVASVQGDVGLALAAAICVGVHRIDCC